MHQMRGQIVKMHLSGDFFQNFVTFAGETERETKA